MRVLFVSSEVAPFSKTGGLGDVAGALPKALKGIRGTDIRVFTPRYKKIDQNKYNLVRMSPEISETTLPGSSVQVYCLEHEQYFGGREELYSSHGRDYEDNLQRFAYFCRAAVELPKLIGWKPDVIHCNDWQSALAAAYVRELRTKDPFYKQTAIIYSTHNIAYSGIFPKESFHETGLSWEHFDPEKLEFWGKIAIAKAGFAYADIITTVSKTYAQEIQTPLFGCGMEGIVYSRRQDLYGILNGIDTHDWDPATDQHINKNFTAETLAFKAENKKALQRANDLPVDKSIPVIGIVTRLCDQKGLDILSERLEDLLKLDFQLVILGTGDKKYHDILKWAKINYPRRIGLNLGFNESIAHQIYAGSDIFLMPSLYEPCGLSQLIGFRYGCVPIVRKTGGLADTVRDYNIETGAGDGFVFEEYSSAALAEAIKRALSLYGAGKAWKKLQRHIMGLDHSWDISAGEYRSLYEHAIKKVRSSDPAFMI